MKDPDFNWQAFIFGAVAAWCLWLVGCVGDEDTASAVRRSLCEQEHPTCVMR